MKTFILMVCFVLSVASSAFGQQGDPCPRGLPRLRATCYVSSATTHLSGNPREASRLFLLAFEQAPSCALLFNGGLALERVPDASGALDLYRRIQFAVCTDRETVLRQAMPAIVRLEATIHRAVPPVVPVTPPIVPVPPVPPVLPVVPLRASFHLSLEEFRLLAGHALQMQITGRSTTSIDADGVDMEELFREPVGVALAEARRQQAASRLAMGRVTRPVPTLVWTLWGVGAVGIGFGVYSLWARGDALDRASQDAVRSERAANTAGISAGVSLGVGVVAAGIGTALFFLRPTRRVAVVPTLGGVEFIARF